MAAIGYTYFLGNILPNGIDIFLYGADGILALGSVVGTLSITSVLTDGGSEGILGISRDRGSSII
jgi:hypothetical protein